MVRITWEKAFAAKEKGGLGLAAYKRAKHSFDRKVVVEILELK